MRTKRKSIIANHISGLSPRLTHLARGAMRFGLLFLGLLLVISLIRNVTTLLSADEKITDTQRRLEALSLENTRLKEQVDQVQSGAYKEQQARDQLGLAKEGETVLILPEQEILKKVSPLVNEESASALPDPNWRKWLKLFL